MPPDSLPVPIVSQSTPYSCGAAVLLSALYYWQVYNDGETSLFAEAGVDPAHGTEPQGIVRGARKHGLTASFKENVSWKELQDALARRETVILDIQAGPNDVAASTVPWSLRWEDGHYVVLVGLDESYAYFMDPTVGTGYTFIPRTELDERWHDYEDRTGTVWRNRRLAIFIRGKTPLRDFPGPLTPTR